MGKRGVEGVGGGGGGEGYWARGVLGVFSGAMKGRSLGLGSLPYLVYL